VPASFLYSVDDLVDLDSPLVAPDAVGRDGFEARTDAV